VLLAGYGCAPEPAPESVSGEEAPESTSGSSVADPGVEAIRLVFLGDSLTAGFGLPEEDAFPALVERRLLEEGRSVRVVNAGVSGDTSAGGASRLDWLLRQEPEVLFVCLGANDGLRGLSPAMTERNLRDIAERATDSGVRVVLAGMRLPPNYGPEYVERFESLFPALAEELDLGFVPFLLEGVAGDPALNLADGIHPNARGHQQMAELVLPEIRATLDRLD
jgi:acyl-CoA thioesterase-1